MESRKCSPSSVKASISEESRKQLMSDMMEKRLYDSYEVCNLLGISLQSLRRAFALKKIKFIHLGRFVRIPAEEVQKLLQGETLFLTVAEASKFLNLSIFAVRTHLKSGKIKGLRFSDRGEWKIAKSEIDRIVREGFIKE